MFTGDGSLFFTFIVYFCALMNVYRSRKHIFLDDFPEAIAVSPTEQSQAIRSVNILGRDCSTLFSVSNCALFKFHL